MSNNIKGKIDRLEAVIHLLAQQAENCDPHIIYFAMEVQRVNDNIYGLDIANDPLQATRLIDLNKDSDRLMENYINGCQSKRVEPFNQ